MKPKAAPIQQFIKQLKEREAASVVEIRGPAMSSHPREPITASDGTQASEIRPEFDVPIHWSKGALLNVRNRGDHYCITLYPEEFDPRHPERALTFPNTWECQDFVSKWYAGETADPRAR